MAKAAVKLDTTEAMAKIKLLQVEADKLKQALGAVRRAAVEAKATLRSFIKVCGDIEIEEPRGHPHARD